MATLRLLQFYNGTPAGTGVTNVYTVPSGHRGVLQSASVKNSSTTGTTTGYIYINGVSVWTFAFGTRDSATGHNDWLPYIVVNEGDVLAVRSPSAGFLNFILSGKLYYI